MAELVKIPFASAEYQARFERPHVAFVGHDWTRAFEAVFDALSPFNLLLANTEIVNTGNLADHKAIFKIPERGISFQFGAEEYRFSKDTASWVTAEDDGQILLAAERALMEGSGAKIGTLMVRVAMHLQPLTKSREEILAPFVPEPFRVLMTQRRLTLTVIISYLRMAMRCLIFLWLLRTESFYGSHLTLIGIPHCLQFSQRYEAIKLPCSES